MRRSIITRGLYNLNADHAVLGNLYNNIGVIHQEKGQFHEAISYYQKALQLDPNPAGIYKNLGTVFHDIGLFDEAITYYRKLSRISPDDAEIYCNLGSVSEDKGQLDESLICLSEGVANKSCLCRRTLEYITCTVKVRQFRRRLDRNMNGGFLRKGRRTFTVSAA